MNTVIIIDENVNLLKKRGRPRISKNVTFQEKVVHEKRYLPDVEAMRIKIAQENAILKQKKKELARVKKRQYSKDYHAKNNTQQRVAQKIYYQNNKDKILAQKAIYYQQNTESLKQKISDRYHMNKAKVNFDTR